MKKVKLTRIGTLFDKYEVKFALNKHCVIIVGENGSYKTKTLELVRDHLIKKNKNVVYFEADRILEISFEEIRSALELLESHAILNKLSGEPYDLELFKRWGIDLSRLELSLRSESGNYINSGFIQLANFITRIINAGPKAIVMIDTPETGLHLTIKRTLLRDLLSLSNIEQLIVVTHSPEIALGLYEQNVWEIGEFVKRIEENVG